ncbi:MAG: hypothetical protein E7H60_19305 [Pseudomonas oryzihabitans]|uniref:hypothetical protein n=1 Tax=Pseudomonas oryzihabitans TaxID=47885 RepID=UPI00291317FB|nr:hypothetical protein [Pseudomonas oryzihabitans]MDU4058691.1 hypothetical protein [Pseudomonas oryzihabitans]
MKTDDKVDAVVECLAHAAAAINSLLSSQIAIVSKLLEHSDEADFPDDRKVLIGELKATVEKCKDLAMSCDKLADTIREEQDGSN